MTIWQGLAVSYAVASRLAYVGWVGAALRGQDRDKAFTRAAGVAAGFRRFRTRAILLMRNDVASLILVCFITRDTLPRDVPRIPGLLVGVLLICVGFATKTWAARALGDDAYYWHNFFSDEPHEAPISPGPYRYLSNPMYTVGYLHAYGLALALGSGPGLAVALFDQAAILVFHHLVEKPHYQRVLLNARSPSAPASPSATR